MAGERTEAPTPRKRDDARQKGQVARSADLSSVAVLLAGLLAFSYSVPGALSHFRAELGACFASVASPGESPEVVLSESGPLALAGLGLIVPMVVAVGIVGVLVNLAQVGPLLTLQPLAPDLNRVNPLKGAGRLFSARSLVETGKALAKMAIIGFVAYQVLRERLGVLAALQYSTAEAVTGMLAGIGLELGQKCALVLGVLAIADYAYQRRSHEGSLRMSRDDIKQEMRGSEGDPHLKSRLRQLARQYASRRMMRDVPRADMVVVNPVHFAVALEYKPEKMVAPVVLAKGRELVALQIRKTANEHGVPIVENPPLARSLFQTTEIGQAIPPTMYEAVAEVLAFIYRLKGTRA